MQPIKSTGGIYLPIDKRNNLRFKKLESELRNKIGIKELNLDILKILGLYDKKGNHNIETQLLADTNNVEFSGLTIIKFAKNSS